MLANFIFSFLQQVFVREIQTRIRNTDFPCRSNDHPWPEIRWLFSPAGIGSPSLTRSDTPGVPDFDLEILWWGLFSLASVHYIRGPSVVTATSTTSHCVLRFSFNLLVALENIIVVMWIWLVRIFVSSQNVSHYQCENRKNISWNQNCISLKSNFGLMWYHFCSGAIGAHVRRWSILIFTCDGKFCRN